MTRVDCYKCGILFAVPTSFDNQRLADVKEWFCPNGHGQVYRVSTATTLRRKLKDAQQCCKSNKEQLEFTNRSLAATKGVVTKMRNQQKKRI